jgi:hypothetical protein
MAQAITQSHAAVAAVQKAEQKPAKKAEFTEYQVARLLGWARCYSFAELPPIWRALKESTDPKDQRTILKNAVLKWGRDNHITIDADFYLTENQIKDIVGGALSPGGAVGSLESWQRGLSNFTVLPKTYKELVAIKKYEEADLATRHTRTMKEYQDSTDKTKCKPPSDYTGLVANTGTFAGMLHVLLGQRCPLAEDVLQMLSILDSPYVKAAKEGYTGERCRRVSWVMFEAAREFFGVELIPDDFRHQNVPRFPVATLSTEFAKVKNVQSIDRYTYPVEFRRMDEAERSSGGSGGGGRENTQPRQQTRGEGNYASLGQGRGGYGAGGRGYGGGRVDNGGRGGAGRGSGAGDPRVAHVHPIIAKMMAKYWAIHGPTAHVGKITQAAGIWLSQLPTIEKYMENGKSTLCVMYCLGRCRHFNCAFKHVAGSELPEAFAKDLCAALGKGVDWCVANDTGPTPRPNETPSGQYGPADRGTKRKSY